MTRQSAGMGDLDIREIAAIDAVALTRSFRLASEAVHTSQSTLSRLIAAAEGKLAVTLFQRGWTGAETTPRGDVVARACRSILDAIAGAEARLFPDRRSGPRLALNLRRAHLVAVSAVLREGSVTAAARRIGRTQPELSRSLSDLAKRFDLDLFRRRPAGLAPTEAALQIAALGDQIDRQLAHLAEALHRLDGAVLGRVAVGVLPFSGQDMVSSAFARISDVHPHVRLSYVPGTYHALVDGLRRGEIDRMVGILRRDACPADLAETHLHDEHFTVVARRDHPLLAAAQDPARLAATHWVVAPHGTPVRAHFERVFAAMALMPPTQTCEILSFSAAEQMLVDSGAVAMLTYSDRKLAALRPDLRPVPVPFPRGRAPVGITRLRQAVSGPALDLFDRILAGLAVPLPGAPS